MKSTYCFIVMVIIFIISIVLIKRCNTDKPNDRLNTYSYHMELLDSLNNLRAKHDSLMIVRDSLLNDNRVKAHMILFLNDELLRFVDGDQDRYNAKFQ